MAMVVKANKHNPPDGGDGGHIASFASLATMIGCGQNHFWHAETENHGGDGLLPGPHLARHVRPRLPRRPPDRRPAEPLPSGSGRQGLSSYPHPKLMPDFWQFPTVSMGLGPLMAIYRRAS